MKKINDTVYKIPLFSALAALLAAVPLRVYQYFKIIDRPTGFFNETDFSVYVIYVMLALATFISMLLPYISHKKMTVVPVAKKSTGFFIVCLLMAIGAIADSAGQLIDYFSLLSPEFSVGYASVQDYVQSQGGTMMLLQAVFGAISAVFFFAAGLGVGIGNTDSYKFKVLAVAPIVWYIFKLLYRFKRTISFVNVSDLLLELFMIVFAMMFFLAFSQAFSKIDEKTVFWKLFSYGIPSAMFALVCFIPRLIMVIVSGKDALNPLYGVNAADFTLAVFAVYICISTAKSAVKTNED